MLWSVHLAASLVRFRTGKGMGYSAHLVGSTLVLETAGKGTKKTHTCAVEFAFQSHHVSLHPASVEELFLIL